MKFRIVCAWKVYFYKWSCPHSKNILLSLILPSFHSVFFLTVPLFFFRCGCILCFSKQRKYLKHSLDIKLNTQFNFFIFFFFFLPHLENLVVSSSPEPIVTLILPCHLRLPVSADTRFSVSLLFLSSGCLRLPLSQADTPTQIRESQLRGCGSVWRGSHFTIVLVPSHPLSTTHCATCTADTQWDKPCKHTLIILLSTLEAS